MKISASSMPPSPNGLRHEIVVPQLEPEKARDWLPGATGQHTGFPVVSNDRQYDVIEDIAATCAEEAQALFCVFFDRLIAYRIKIESKAFTLEFCFAAESIFTIRREYRDIEM
jgi:hypothetical protein